MSRRPKGATSLKVDDNESFGSTQQGLAQTESVYTTPPSDRNSQVNEIGHPSNSHFTGSLFESPTGRLLHDDSEQRSAKGPNVVHVQKICE